MATQLDEKIEQLQSIVEQCFEFYQATAGSSLSLGERPAEPHQSPIEFLTERVP